MTTILIDKFEVGKFADKVERTLSDIYWFMASAVQSYDSVDIAAQGRDCVVTSEVTVDAVAAALGEVSAAGETLRRAVAELQTIIDNEEEDKKTR